MKIRIVQWVDSSSKTRMIKHRIAKEGSWRRTAFGVCLALGAGWALLFWLNYRSVNLFDVPGISFWIVLSLGMIALALSHVWETAALNIDQKLDDLERAVNDKTLRSIPPLLEELLEHNKFKGNLYLARGQCFEKIGKAEQAQDDFDRATKNGVRLPTESLSDSDGNKLLADATPAVRFDKPCGQCAGKMQRISLTSTFYAHSSVGTLWVRAFLCIDCGYVELWVEDAHALQKLRELSSRASRAQG